MRIGPRCDKTIGNLYSETGHSIPWVTEMRYLGIYFVQSRKLKCSLDALSEGFIALTIVYLARLDELCLKKSFYKLFQANVCQF